MSRFLNPYNFVRPLPAPNPGDLTQDNADLHLLWRCSPPPQDRYTGLSGRIICKMTAKTPVFVSDGTPVSDVNGHKTYRFFNVDGQDLIPASSLRGPIRSVFEAATNSTWSSFTDQQLSYREITDNANKLIPARLELDATTKVWRLIRLDGGLGVSRSLLPAASVPFDLLDSSQIEWEHGQFCFAIMHVPNNKPNLLVDALLPYKDGEKVDIPQQYYSDKYIKSPGYLCITGRNAENKSNERFFFRTALTPTIELTREVIGAYNTLIENRREYHKEFIDKFNESDDWSTEESEPSRYLLGARKEEFIGFGNTLVTSESHNFLVYARLETDPDTNTTTVKYLAPVSIPRVPETRSFYQIMKQEGYGHLLPSTNHKELSLADRLFGWVDPKPSKDKANTTPVAYRGRVRFTHAQLEQREEDQPQPSPLGSMSLSILSAPKPTTTRFYVNPKRELPANVNRMSPIERQNLYSDNTLRYGEKGNKLRGRKFYLHHGRLWKCQEEAMIADERLNSDQNRTISGAHDVGTSYTFSIYFENLQPVELGALLWTLQLKDGDFQGYHRIGYGKPLGFGSVEIAIAALDFDDPAMRYSSDHNTEITDGLPKVEQLIGLFKTTMMALYHIPFDELVNVQDIKVLLSEPRTDQDVDSIHYPRSRRGRNQRDGDENYQWFMDNKRPASSGGPNFVLPYATDDVEGFPYLHWEKGRNRGDRGYVHIDDN